MRATFITSQIAVLACFSHVVLLFAQRPQSKQTFLLRNYTLSHISVFSIAADSTFAELLISHTRRLEGYRETHTQRRYA